MVVAARRACANWCVGQGLTAEDLRELLEMLSLLNMDDGVATLTERSIVPTYRSDFRPKT